MKRFLIPSTLAFMILVTGVSVNAEEIGQKYIVTNNVTESANLETQINLELKQGELENTVGKAITEETLIGETSTEGVVKIISRDDCILPDSMTINILKEEVVIVKPLICNSSEIFVHAGQFIEAIDYNIDWNGETNSIVIHKDIEFDENSKVLNIAVDGTGGFTENGIYYVPLSKIIAYADLDYEADMESNVLKVLKKLSIDDIKNQNDVSIYSIAKEIYDKDLNNVTYIAVLQLEEYKKSVGEDVVTLYMQLNDVFDGIFTDTKELEAWKSANTNRDIFKFSLKVKDVRLTEEEQKIVDAYVATIKEKAANLSIQTDEEKVKLINNEINKLTSYNTNFKLDDLQNAYDSSNTAYGAITTKKSVCQGYANLFTLLAEELDIPVIKVRGYGKKPVEAHVWNSVYVEANGKLDWYYVDSTWNDARRVNTYLLTTAEFEETKRTWDREIEQVTRDIKYKDLKVNELVEKSLKQSLDLVDTQ